MKTLLTTTFLLLISVIAHAQAEVCYSLYMQPSSDDPGKACIVFSEEGQAQVLNLYMTNRELKESIQLNSTEQAIAYKGHLALHYNTITGVGQFHTVNASQAFGTYKLNSLRVYSTVDGHLQQTVEFNPPAKPNTGCVPGRRCI
ncbi:hypothetical protein CIK05_08975 [Bdellovibrio sp. qaytius]|nr:hypothetical protein CIK05_08975 [Bdellovibrio sp. qaytius]